MSARPYDTFQSEGYYNTGRAQHYFRPTTEDSGQPFISLCGRWKIGDGHRPWLTALPKKFNPCKKCFARINEELMKPQSEPWFGEVHL